jgi:hypothetical protein
MGDHGTLIKRQGTSPTPSSSTESVLLANTTVYARPHSPTRRFSLTINRAGRRTTFIATFLTLSTVHARLAPHGVGSAGSP